METNFKQRADELLNRIRELVPSWLPGGHLEGAEYCCGNLGGGMGNSCKINLQTGMWADFATGERGGDLISLYAAIHGISQGESVNRLFPSQSYVNSKVPRETPRPDMKHHKFGFPSNTWAYRAMDGDIISYVARYETPDGKTFLPWSWDGKRWVNRGLQEPRPLYGLDRLAKGKPDAPILIVEGEKTCDAACKLTSLYIPVTWPNGSKAVNKSDWSVIYGRKILIWPDADEPGLQAAQRIATILSPHCPEIKIIQVNPSETISGWDASDALQEGWNTQKFYDWAKPRAYVFNNINITNNVTFNVGENDDPVQNESYFVAWQRLGLALTSGGSPIPNEDNVIRIFEGEKHLNKRIWFDDFYRTIFVDGNPPHDWQDIDTYELTVTLQRVYGLTRISDSIVRRAITIIANRTHKNEPLDWMESLVWDQTPRIETFFTKYMGADATPYTLAASKNFWVSLAARTYDPGCIMRSMVVLKSKQFTGKSTAFAIIGGKWYSEAVENIQSNNFLQSLHGQLIVEFADMSGMDRADINRVKQIISCRRDNFRAPYDRTPKAHLRRCVLVSTTNEDHFLRDDTGGTRFWPIITTDINLKQIESDRAQLFAEAVYSYKNNHGWHIMPVDETNQVQEFYRQSDEWESVIYEYFQTNYIISETTIKDVARDCLKISLDKLDKATQMRIARNLRVIGWNRRQLRREDGRVVVWSRDVLTVLTGDGHLSG